VADARNPKALIFRQDLQDNQDNFAFPEERQKASSLFEGTHLAFAVGELLSVNFSPARLAWLAIAGRRKLADKKNPINPVNPVKSLFGFMFKN
jgi:hypothetical protein